MDTTIHRQALKLCQSHAKQHLAGKPLSQLRTWALVREGLCRIEGCEGPCANSHGLCAEHRARHRAGRPDWDAPIKRLERERGTGTINSNGYLVVPNPQGGRPRLAHHVAFEAAWGKGIRTDKGEQIHHINGDRLDNQTDGPPRMNQRGNLWTGNLELWSTSQPAGQEIGPKINWAIEFLGRYANELDSQRAYLVAEELETLANNLRD
ncbi:HNH endonuclease [Kineococcus rhizosphaerae]|uniref:HNH endonuclease n=1 Tax=Kineococcus rhizosphaerae TaxID=559628 RepID=UPI00147443C8|nr:HNH endonuclease [Kineococcus rhizosphaerae]